MHAVLLLGLVMICSYNMVESCGNLAEPAEEYFETTEPYPTTETEGYSTALDSTTEALDTTEKPVDPLEECFGDDVKCQDRSLGSASGQVNSGRQLSCNFDGSQGCGCWENDDSDDLQWLTCQGTPDSGAIRDCFGTSEKPSGNFLSSYVSNEVDSGDHAILFSCSVECAQGGELTLKHWTKNAELKACIRPTGSPNYTPNCETISGDGKHTLRFLDGSRQVENFDMLLIATRFVGSNGGIAAIDDVDINFGECVDPTTPAPPDLETESTEPYFLESTALPYPEGSVDACDLNCGKSSGDCDFGWDLNQQPGSSQWQEYKGTERVGNFDSGADNPPGGGNFLGAETPPGAFAILNSKDVYNLAGKQIKVTYHDSLDGAVVQLCEVSGGALECPFTSEKTFTEESNDWNSAVVNFQTTQAPLEKLQLVCDNEQGQNYGACGVAGLEVYDYGNPGRCTRDGFRQF